MNSGINRSLNSLLQITFKKLYCLCGHSAICCYFRVRCHKAPRWCWENVMQQIIHFINMLIWGDFSLTSLLFFISLYMFLLRAPRERLVHSGRAPLAWKRLNTVRSHQASYSLCMLHLFPSAIHSISVGCFTHCRVVLKTEDKGRDEDITGRN